MRKVYTPTEIFSKLFGKKRREIRDLIYNQDLINFRFGVDLFLLKYIIRSLLARITHLHLEILTSREMGNF